MADTPIDTAAPHPLALEGALLLPQWAVIHAKGADAGQFLQGQLTQDVLGLGLNEARLAGYCSAKGRLLGSFVLWREAPDHLVLLCSSDLSHTVLKRLTMFVMRARCTLSLDDNSAVWGLAGANAGAAAEQHASSPMWHLTRTEASAEVPALRVVRLPDARVPDSTGGARPSAHLGASEGRTPRWVGLSLSALPLGPAEPRAAPPPSLPLPLRALPPLLPATWEALEAASLTPRIQSATVEQFVPQMVNLELVGGVSFSKGCFPGQEVVARSQYRGTLKRRSVLVAGRAPMPPGTELFHSADVEQPAGKVVLSGALGERHLAMVEVKIAALAHGSLHVGAAAGPAVDLVPLPYPVPLESA